MDATYDHDMEKLQLLKCTLVLRQLDDIPDATLHARILDQGEAAMTLARQTAFPILVFPCLFEERAVAVLWENRQRMDRYWNPAGEITSPFRAVSALRD